MEHKVQGRDSEVSRLVAKLEFTTTVPAVLVQATIVSFGFGVPASQSKVAFGGAKGD